MSDDLPAPLVPVEVDLRDFAFMPLDVVRLRDSDLAAEEQPEACWAAVLLWCASWHQVPAGSIPDSDQWQAKQAGYVARGRVDKAWETVRAGALRNWIACSDGRLYHPVIAEKARTAWAEKQARRARTVAATAAREAKAKAEQAARDDQRNDKRDVARGEERGDKRNDQRDVPRDVHQGRVKGQGEGEGQGIKEPIPPTLAGGPPLAPKPETATPTPPKAKPKPTKTAIPDGFAVSPRVAAWATARGFDRIDEHLEAFRRKVAANGYRYADWDAAFQEAIREDWAKLRGRPMNGAAPAPDAPPAWHELRSGVIGRGTQLGLLWSEVDDATGNANSWPAYRRRVMEADPAQASEHR